MDLSGTTGSSKHESSGSLVTRPYAGRQHLEVCSYLSLDNRGKGRAFRCKRLHDRMSVYMPAGYAVKASAKRIAIPFIR
jgi:hypothetical protein